MSVNDDIRDDRDVGNKNTAPNRNSAEATYRNGQAQRNNHCLDKPHADAIEPAEQLANDRNNDREKTH